MKKIVYLLASLLLVWFSFAEIDHFYIETRPENVVVNEAIDIIVKALDAWWDVVTDYETELVFLTIEWWEEEDYELANETLSFTPENQWEIIVSKDLKFNKPWVYTIKVEDIVSDSYFWEVDVVVSWEDDWESDYTLDVLTPTNWEELRWSIDVYAESNMPNNWYEIYLNWEKVVEDLTDENWSITTIIDWLQSWENTLYIALIDITWEEIYRSDDITLYWKETTWELYKTIEFIPSNTVNNWDNVTVIVRTDPTVNWVELTVDQYWTNLMDSIWEWEFSFDMVAEIVWTFPVSLNLVVEWINNEYSNVDTLTVVDNISIKEVKYQRLEWDKLDLEWNYTWNPAKFRVVYWVEENQMNNEIVVDVAEAQLEEIDNINTYYLQVFPLDENDIVNWTESALIVIEPNQMWSATCKVEWIKIKTMQEWDSHYLTWEPVDWADKYVVYKSNTKASQLWDMEKVWETTETKFQYPFDAEAEEDMYEYYWVEAECSDWSNLQVDEIKKVKVWPLNTILWVFVFAVIAFVWIRLYKYSK